MSIQLKSKFKRRKIAESELSVFTVGSSNIDDVINSIVRKANAPRFLVVDLFCGAGGTSTGFEMTDGRAQVIACVNHDYMAIKSHWRNYPHIAHFEEDIRTLELAPLVKLLNHYRMLYPEAKVILWASLECTNFSKAKGGQPRDADSRTLADHLDRYITALNPDYVQIENVVEFMSWGPLDENGKPVSRKNGTDWMRWRNHINSFGYYDEWREMNSADYGAYTSRNRLFGCFAKHGLPIAWPAPTHAKKPNMGSMFDTPLQKWKAVKDVLDFSDEGKSIFNRNKPLCDKTLEVIATGLIKCLQSNEPGFLFKYYGNGDNINELDRPAGTITTKDRFALILRQYKRGFTTSISEPIGALPTNPKANLVTFIMNKSHGGHTTSTDQPCPVIVARQDKAPLYFIRAIMDANGIADITMRMLKVMELLPIQGFPVGFQLEGSQADQKKFIGNSVVPLVVKRWCLALDGKLSDDLLKVA
jgi:DNA (cytosine-5)-methyltransferase 1